MTSSDAKTLTSSCTLWLLTAGVAGTLFFSYLAHTQAALWQSSALLGLGLTGLLSLHFKQSFKEIPKQVSLPFVIWTIWTSVSIVWSLDPLTSLELVAENVWLPALFLTAVLYLGRKPHSLRLCIYALCLGILAMNIAALTALYLKRIDILASGNAPDLAAHPIMRWYLGPGLVSTLSIITLPMIYWIYAEKLLPRWCCIGLGILTLITASATLNRFFWLSAFVQSVIFVLLCILQPGLKRIMTAKALVGLILAAVLCSCLFLDAVMTRQTSFIPATTNFSDRVEKTFTADPRVHIWQYWLNVYQQSPILGTGFGKPVATLASIPTLKLYDTMDKAGRTHSHNLLLNTLLQTGIIGLCIFSWLLFATARLGWQALSSQKASAITLITLVTGLVVKNLTDDFYDKRLSVVFWIFIALLIGRICHQLPKQTEPRIE